MATRHFVPREYPFAFTNGVQASWLEVDTDTGFVKLLQALGGRGLRHHHQSATGRRADPGRRGAGPRRGAVREMHLRRARAAHQRQHGRLPGSDVRRNARISMWAMWCRRRSESELGAKGAGEAGTGGSGRGAWQTRSTTRFRPFGAIITEIPLTPQVILSALGRI